MKESILIQISKEELVKIIDDAINNSRLSNQNRSSHEPPIRGIRGLAEFLKISRSKAQKLKNDKIVPYFQNEKLILFDPVKVRESIDRLQTTKSFGSK